MAGDDSEDHTGVDMRCCRCGEEMLVVEYAQIEIDYCSDCGIWLDSGELELILEHEGVGTADGGTPPAPSDGDRDDKPIKCPVCRTKMQKGRYDELARPVIDRCPKKHGIWFDCGELKEIVKTRVADDGAAHTAVISFLAGLFGKEEV